MPDLLRVDGQSNAQIAVLHYPARRARNVHIVAGHGYSSSKHNLDFLCAFLAGHGIDMWSLDFPGHKLGASGGELRGIDDCIDAMEAVTQHVITLAQSAPIYTMGHSMGAMTALFCASRDPRLAGAIAITTGYGRPSALASLERAGATDFRSGWVDGVTLPVLVAHADLYFERYLGGLAGRDALYIAGSRDAMVNAASVRELFDHAPQPKSFVTIDSDHTTAADNAKSTILAWLNERHAR